MTKQQLFSFTFSLSLLTSPNLLAAQEKTASTKEVRFTFVGTSDVHGNYFPYDFLKKKVGEGSLARVATYIRTLRDSLGKDNVFLVDNGDFLQGQPSAYYSNFVDSSEVQLATRVMNQMDYLCANLGNHDIETGHGVYDRWINDGHFTMLGANVRNTKTKLGYCLAYTMEEVGGINIGIIGLTTPAIPQWLPEELWKDMAFRDITSEAKRIVPMMRGYAEADIVVCLIHSGLGVADSNAQMLENAAMQVAEQVPNVDLIIFGHDHQIANRVVKNKRTGQSVLLLNPGANATHVAKADFKISVRNKKIAQKQIAGSIVDVRSLTPDAEFMDTFMEDFARVQHFTEQDITDNKTDLDSRTTLFGPTPFMELIHRTQLQVAKADVSIAAPLSIDAHIPKGKISVADIFNLYRYENKILAIAMSGAELKNYLEESYALWTQQMATPQDHMLLLKTNATAEQSPWQKLQNPIYNFDTAFGIKYTVDLSKPKGSKITILSMADGKPFNLDQKYRVALNSYRACGGGNLLSLATKLPASQLKTRVLWTSNRDLRHYLIEELKANKTLEVNTTYNWHFTPDGWFNSAAERDYDFLFGTSKH